MVIYKGSFKSKCFTKYSVNQIICFNYYYYYLLFSVVSVMVVINEFLTNDILHLHDFLSFVKWFKKIQKSFNT